MNFLGLLGRKRDFFFPSKLFRFRASQVAQWSRIRLPMRETQVRSLGQEDPQGEEWQSTPVFLFGKSHGQRSLAGYSPWGWRVGQDLVTKQQFSFKFLCKMWT